MSLNIKQINKLLDIHINYCVELNKFKNKHKIITRCPNFPEIISENIVKEYINIIEKRKCIKSKSGGDLELELNEKYKIEVKCFTSDGPSSFGPTESWNEIYFVDAKNFINKTFIIYKINISNNSDEFKKIQINTSEIYEDICKKGKRPRINFTNLIKNISSEKYTKTQIKIFNDKITLEI